MQKELIFPYGEFCIFQSVKFLFLAWYVMTHGCIGMLHQFGKSTYCKIANISVQKTLKSQHYNSKLNNSFLGVVQFKRLGWSQSLRQTSHYLSI